MKPGDVVSDQTGLLWEIVGVAFSGYDWECVSHGHPIKTYKHFQESELTLFTPVHSASYRYTVPATWLYLTKGGSPNGFTYGWDTSGKWGHIDDSRPADTGCRHEWVDAGFHFSVWCCRKCNLDKPKE